jgi:hypothetical protein
LKDDTLDPEELAAFLDDSLSAQRREEVLRILARNPAAYESFLDAAAILSGDEIGELALAGSGSRGTYRLIPWAAAATICAGLIALGLYLPHSRLPARFDPISAVTTLSLANSSVASQLGESWLEPGWRIVRGEEAEAVERLSGEVLAFHLGVRVVDVEVAMASGDGAALDAGRARLAGLLRMAGGGPFVARYELFAVNTTPASERQRAAASVRELAGASPWFDLGQWAELARFSVTARKSAVFDAQGRTLAGIIDRLMDLGGERANAVLPALRGALGLARNGLSVDELPAFGQHLERVFTASGD